jgi:hypothetical protein
MPQLNVKTSKPVETKKSARSHYIVQPPACRRCGDAACACSDDELDAGGPAA